MKRNGKLFWNAFLIASKHSGRRLLCLLCVLLFCVGILGVFFNLPQEKTIDKAKIGVINLDENPLSVTMVNNLLAGENLSEILEVTLLSDESERKNYTAIFTIPAGFLESILTGENLSPILEINQESPLEAIWVRQMAIAGARSLSAAQMGIYTVLEAAESSEIDVKTYQIILADINLTMINEFFDRLSLLDETELSVSGTLSLPQYYVTALIVVLLFCYGFLFYPAMENLRKFSTVVQTGKRVIFLAGAIHIFFLEGLLILPLFLPIIKENIGSWILLTLIAGGTALLSSIIFPNRASCAAASILLTLGQALFSGLLIPLALLPKYCSVISVFFPVRQAMMLLGAV